MSTPGFPISRADLYNHLSPKLDVTIEPAFEHIDDENYVRNNVSNSSRAILIQAKLGRKTWAQKVKNSKVEGIVAGLKVNFPDVQIVVKVLQKDSSSSEIRAFWT